MKTIVSKQHGITLVKYFLLTLFVALSTNALQAQSPRNMFRRVMPSVVIVQAEKKAVAYNAGITQSFNPTIGSGALISADGKVLTAASVVRDADKITVEFFNGSRIPARVIATSSFADVALLELERVPVNAIVAKLGDSSRTEVGEQVFIIGSPAGIAQSLSVGFVSARLTLDKANDAAMSLEMLQVDAALKVGNSGGPVFNLNGEVVGMVSHALTKSNQSAKGGLAVTSNVLSKLVIENNRRR